MGVKKLWSIIDSVKQRKSLADLRGQVVAVDLSIWIMEAQTLTQLQHLKKPYLRHVFFRVSHLLHIGVIPVIVVEGIPPDLKQATMQQRRHGGGSGRRRGERGNQKTGVINTNESGEIKKPEKKLMRTRFNAVHKECCEMLECLGVTWVQSHGEAEAMCAYLNRVHLVDGCITNDGDVFLYGATTVYRNFTINIKDPHVYRYKMVDIENKLRLGRDNLVGLAIVLGCDYLPGGLPGVGRDMFFKLVAALPPGRSLLDRFDLWLSNEGVELFGMEKTVARKAGSILAKLPYKEVIDEFLVNRDKYPNIAFEWKRPKMFPFMWYALEKMEWPDEYSYSKILPLVTKFDMKKRTLAGDTFSPCRDVEGGLQPRCIVKTRVRQGVPCYQVLWHSSKDCPAMSEELCMTIEEQALFTAAYPEMTEKFVSAAREKQNSKKSKKKGAKQTASIDTPDSLLERLARIELSDPVHDVETAIQPSAMIDFPSRRLDNPYLASPQCDLMRATPLKGLLRRRRSKSVTSYCQRSYPSSTPGRRYDEFDVRFTSNDEEEVVDSKSNSSDDERRNYSDSEDIRIDTKCHLEGKVFLDSLYATSSKKILKDLVNFRCDINEIDLLCSDGSESVKSTRSPDSDYQKDSKFKEVGEERFDVDESNEDLFNDSSDTNSACSYIPLNRRLKMASDGQPKEFDKRISHSVSKNFILSSSHDDSNIDKFLNVVVVAQRDKVFSGSKPEGCNSTREEASCRTPVNSSNEIAHCFRTLTPWSETNIGRFDIETSILDDLPSDCRTSSGVNSLKFAVSRDQFDSSSSSDGNSEEDTERDDFSVANSKMTSDNSSVNVDERTSNDFGRTGANIKMERFSSSDYCVSRSTVLNNDVVTNRLGEQREEMINLRENLLAPSTPRILSLAERLAQKLGGQKVQPINSSRMDALAAMLK